MKLKIILLSIFTCVGLTIFVAVSNQSQTKVETPIIPTSYQNVLAAPPVPTTLFFAEEKVPLDIYWVKEGLEKELIINCFQHSKTLTTLKRSTRFFPVMEKILNEEGIPLDMLYLCVTESNLENVVSPAKASGFWQFMSPTGKSYGLEINEYVDERYHLEKATRAACQYLKELKAQFGSWSLAAAAYNMGQNGLRRSMERQQCDNYWDLYLNPETSRYVYRILAYKLMLENKESYGIQLQPNDYYYPIPSQDTTVTSSISNLMEFAKQHKIAYRELKELNPWLRNTSLPVSAKTYTLKLPKNSAKFDGQFVQ